MPGYIKGVELTQDGMRAIFERMGQDITSGIIYNGNPELRLDILQQQGFMPILTGVSPTQESGHWIMLIKGQGDHYYLFDPLGEGSGTGYKNILSRKLPQGATLSVIPNARGLNMGLCGYWVASAGVRAHNALTGENPPTLENLGQTITQEMQNELADNGYGEITAWLRAVAHKFPAGDAQPDATMLRHATAQDIDRHIPMPIVTGKTTPKELSTQPTVTSTSPSILHSTLMEDDTDIREAVAYVHQEYLRHPYPGPVVDLNNPEKGRIPPNEGPDRTTHGLAHTVRTMACAEIMVEEARKARFRGEKIGVAQNGQSLADVSSEELKKILIAQAFFVVGRDDERSGANEDNSRNFYDEYHEKSEAAFRKYVADNQLIGKVFKDQGEVDFYAAIILDNPHNWDGTPAHVLIHQGHMVDLMRVKLPQEVVLERAYHTLQKVVGSLGAEVVLKTHREFLLATGSLVPQYNPEAIKDPSRGGPYENPYSGQKYIIQEGTVANTKDELQKVNGTYQLQEKERFITIKEYYAIPEVQELFPGFKTYLPYKLPKQPASLYEKIPAACLGAIKEVRAQSKMNAIKEAVQSPSGKARRQATPDEVAAARIIQQIMANPDVIHNDHVLLNGQRLEEQFFRNLLAKCDMAIVGSLLNNTDINNIDRLMQHEKDTDFHPTNPKDPAKKIGETWEKSIRKQNGYRDQIKHDLVVLMQNDGWYYSRVNAIAQNRDKDSTFKEVMLTALLTPLTNKSLVDIHGQASSPKTLFRGLYFSETDQNKLINQANSIIAHSAKHLFSDLSAQSFMQIKLNDLSKISAKTNASNSVNIEVPRTIFSSNTIFEINDPEELLQAKQVGKPIPGSEDEFSFYLSDDVALIPTKVTYDGKTPQGEDRYIFSFTAIKSPDFMPRHEHGFAIDPFLAMQTTQLTTLRNTVTHAHEEPNLELLFYTQSQLSRQIRTSVNNRYKTFLKEQVNSAVENCLNALLDGNANSLRNALASIPSEAQWIDFTTQEAQQIKTYLDTIKQMAARKLILEGQTLPALTQCENALAKKDIPAALKALNSIPSAQEMSQISSISVRLREQIQQAKQSLLDNLTPLQHAVISPLISNEKQVKSRYETLIANISQRIKTLDSTTHDNVSEVKQGLLAFNALQEEIKVLRNEKVRFHAPSEQIDFSDIEQLEEQQRIVHNKLYNAYVIEITAELDLLAKEKPKNLHTVKEMVARFNERLAEIKQLTEEKIKKHGSSKEPLDLADINQLTTQLQPLNQFLVQAMLNALHVSFNQIEVTTFDEQSKDALHNLQLLEKLASTLDHSETAQKYQQGIVKLNQFFIEKQQAYPAMLQLQFKSEALIIRLRELCEAHQNKVSKATQTKTTEITKNRRFFHSFTDFFRLTTDERISLAKKDKLLTQFKKDLNNDSENIQHLLSKLAQRSPAELAEAIGLTTECAEKLYEVLDNLKRSTTFVNKIETRSQLIDEVLNELANIERTQTNEEALQQNIVGF